MKTDLSLIALLAALAALPVFADGPKASDFRLKVTGVAVAEDNRSGKYAVGKPLPADTRVVVGSERQLAMFFVEYELPAAAAGFTDNLDEAIAKAKAEGKLVYACFSGSDWCGWCKRLESEVLSDQLFVAGAADDFVQAFIDDPRDKSLLSDHAKAENKKLIRKYGIQGFPTALVLDGDGKSVGKTGYRAGGAAKYLDHLREIAASARK